MLITDYDIFQNNFKIIIPELFFIIAITFILLYGVIYSPMKTYKFPILTSTVGWLSIQSLIITILLMNNQINLIGNTCTIFNNVLIFDDFTHIIKIIVLLSALFTIYISFDYIKGQKINSFEYIILILIATLSMLFIISSFDLISIYLAIELQSLSFYVLAAFQRNNEFSTEAGLKYFILGALSSGFLLFGESIIYGFTGITNLEELTKIFAFNSMQNVDLLTINTQISDELTNNLPNLANIDYLFNSTNAIYIGLLFMLVAFLFKIGAVPFHMWTPDVYEGSPTSVTAFFSITPKIAIVAILLRLCLYTFYDLIDAWQLIIVISAILSMYIGTFGAINQTKIKRLFAYSSIAHVGYILIGLGTGTIEAIESLLLYIIIYIVMVINIFAFLLTMPKEESRIINNFGDNNPNYQIKNLNYFHIYKYSCRNNINELNVKDKRLSFTDLLDIGNPLYNKYSKLNIMENYKSGTIGLKEKDVLIFEKIPNVKSLNALKRKDNYIKYITDLSSLSKTNPLLAATLAIAFFSNAGVPPLAGFYGKLNVFLAAIEGSMYFLAFAAIICSVIGAFYSIRLIKILYYHNITTSWLKWTHYKPVRKENAIVLAITFFFTTFFFLYPSFLWTLTHSAALALCL